MNTCLLYLHTFLLAALTTGLTLPLLRMSLGRALLDTPTTRKQHARATPLVGGFAIMFGLAASLIFIRLTTDFPSGTLHSLRGILCGAAMIFALGILDDVRKPAGMSIPFKLIVQMLAVLCLLRYGVHISLDGWPYLSYLLTFLWVMGITNAFNLLDISDGLCTSQAVVCALGLLFISLPSEQIYVNFAACALLGACMGFWPYNHLQKYKTFLGDSGSTLLGFLVAALAMGADYSEISRVGFLAPLLILAVPIFDTGFVSLVRLAHGKNPMRATPDHAALRLRRKGLPARRIVSIFLAAGLLCNALAYFITQVSVATATGLCILTLLIAAIAAYWLTKLPPPPYE